MPSLDKVNIAKHLITESLQERILSTEVDDNNNRLKIRLKGNSSTSDIIDAVSIHTISNSLTINWIEFGLTIMINTGK